MPNVLIIYFGLEKIKFIHLILYLFLFCIFITWLLNMAHLPSAEIQSRRQHATQDIIQEWQTMQGAEWYALQCPCHPNCECMPHNEVPRIVLSQCMYVGELDYFFVEQPFLATYGFRVRWHYDECESEMACGFPLS